MTAARWPVAPCAILCRPNVCATRHAATVGENAHETKMGDNLGLPCGARQWTCTDERRRLGTLRGTSERWRREVWHAAEINAMARAVDDAA